MSRNLPTDKLYKLDKKNRKSTSVEKSQINLNIKNSYDKRCSSTKNSKSREKSLFDKLQNGNKKYSSRLQMKMTGQIP